MDEQPNVSTNIIDRRHIVGAGAGAFIAWLAALAMIRPGTSTIDDPDRDLVQVTSTALDRGQTFWAAQVGPSWHDAHVVLFTDHIASPCGEANAMTGPFYCPVDEHVYLDLAFLRSIRGELARAYVIAHELGHHVQKLRAEIGASDSVRVELEADCYAGTWMSDEQKRGHLGSGDVDAALAEAAAVGDTGTRDTWTHGDAAHRMAAVSRGIGGEKCAL